MAKQTSDGVETTWVLLCVHGVCGSLFQMILFGLIIHDLEWMVRVDQLLIMPDRMLVDADTTPVLLYLRVCLGSIFIRFNADLILANLKQRVRID